jgi:MFS superfamily sulfate permease-like transporter
MRPSQGIAPAFVDGSSSRPYSLLPPMALAACVGSLISGPMLIVMLGNANDYPALYPCPDMFMAPFLAQMAADVDGRVLEGRKTGGRYLHDDVVVGDNNDTNDDDAAAFLATFAALNAFGMIVCGLFCVLACRIKLANLVSYLPYPVLCGFFSSVGLSVWLSAFKVDAGMTLGTAYANGTLMDRIGRHVPSVIAGAGMYSLGPRGSHKERRRRYFIIQGRLLERIACYR